ncbi:DUF4194 domain-containing protein [Jeongeupia sp. USM3]|uniref:DUF4194 domain-containing protein n=1 Tax=Jeongeupia sp. USM3 TaxID=1906741 RepID=UPI00089E09EA|nr:DUF4194 domain-containing protein [Jeongeupia sp. USM3]AOY00911.1 hypothetical protein BJP62_10950 [Jeongeupia sp. USM3]
MFNQWQQLAEASGCFDAVDFERAAYRLMTDQVIYRDDHGCQQLYFLIERYEKALQKVLEPFGVKLRVNPEHNYAVALPTHERQTPVPSKLTVLALVLLKLYHLGAQHNGFNDQAEIECDLPSLQQLYVEVTAGELPRVAELDDMLRHFKRWGIARRVAVTSDVGDAGAQPFVIMIRPAILDVLGEGALARLAGWQAGRGESVTGDNTAAGADNDNMEPTDEAA